MQRIGSYVLRGVTGQVGRCQAARSISIPPSFNPETYLRFPQFLHDINNRLTIYRDTTQSENILNEGRLIYSNKLVTVERQAELTLESLSEEDWRDLRDLNKACKSLFWQSAIDYTIVPCTFKMEGEFSAERFLQVLGLSSEAFRASIHVEYFAGAGMLPRLPIISYQSEDTLNVYRAPQEGITAIIGKYDEVYHLTIGEGVINPVLQFIVAKTEGDLLIGFMSASLAE